MTAFFIFVKQKKNKKNVLALCQRISYFATKSQFWLLPALCNIKVYFWIFGRIWKT